MGKGRDQLGNKWTNVEGGGGLKGGSRTKAETTRSEI